jgi:glycosyltransferase involved in cell wall biosynthesis
MRGAALYFAKKMSSLEHYDGLITTDLMSLSDLKALLGSSCPPCLAYFHENQLTYPLAPGETMDFQFGFTDITTGLVADRVLFNSRSHFDTFFSHARNFVKMMPEYQPKWAIEAIRAKAGILYPGCQFSARREKIAFSDSSPPLIVWNHRWEFDKNPGAFFDALAVMLERGLEFRLALLGENFQKVPKEFISARERFGHRIVQYGYVESRKEYMEWLDKGCIVVSTSNQENFGISIVEAIRAGCIPLVPDRLVYPEIIPKAFHADFLYSDQEDFVDRLSFLVSNYSNFKKRMQDLSKAMECFSWDELITRYDEELQKLTLM